MKTRLVYFAWVRERIGTGEEELELPDSVVTVSDLLTHLTTLGDGYAAALQYPKVIRVALNQEHVDHHEKIADASEIALFPPMTGG
ncbi:molybdopterin converting factor subunit 1 [Pararhizobium sp.]|uniref:molybdopterin converting factor subunit 1 n=1 Tax=Pararhizobium sp. TaxID=1977563 RepID=UPI00271FFC33|nr:molybdopterin converting factor subunit 1 [Pararhizobium sp.]MDO9417589.1 molybdopterin converting factor subunit 1 [Pararhizobium sp.]